MKWKQDSLVPDRYRLDFNGLRLGFVSLNDITRYWSYWLYNSPIAGHGFNTAQEAQEAAITALIVEARKARTQETKAEEEET